MMMNYNDEQVPLTRGVSWVKTASNAKVLGAVGRRRGVAGDVALAPQTDWSRRVTCCSCSLPLRNELRPASTGLTRSITFTWTTYIHTRASIVDTWWQPKFNYRSHDNNKCVGFMDGLDTLKVRCLWQTNSFPLSAKNISLSTRRKKGALCDDTVHLSVCSSSASAA